MKMKKNLIIKNNHIRSTTTTGVAAATPSAPLVPVKVYENSDTQKLELLKESRGEDRCLHVDKYVQWKKIHRKFK